MKRLAAVIAPTIIMLGYLLFHWASPSGDSLCPDDPLRGVWGPQRLELLGECVSVSGIAHSIKEGGDIEADQSTDGDVTFNLTVDDEHWEKFGPVLHVEVVPISLGHVYIPSEGEHVCIVGTWAWDRTHGLAEIHPAFQVKEC